MSIPDLGAPRRLILLSGPQVVQMGKSMNLHPTALLLPLTEPALFHPLAGWKEEGKSLFPVGFGAYFERM